MGARLDGDAQGPLRAKAPPEAFGSSAQAPLLDHLAVLGVEEAQVAVAIAEIDASGHLGFSSASSICHGRSSSQVELSEGGKQLQILAQGTARRVGLSSYSYSEDLRKNIVEAKEQGMPTIEVARTFIVGLSSVKRYVKVAREEGSLHPRRSPGRRPKTDECARRLLEADLRERRTATLSQRR